jgi:hypothetical protein
LYSVEEGHSNFLNVKSKFYRAVVDRAYVKL